MDFRKVILNTDHNIRDAMQALDSAALRIVIVCDQELKLLGTVTDGDIRRGLLSDCEMTDSITKVMNKNPLTAQCKASRSHRLKIMEEYDLLALPIVDEEKHLIDLETLNCVMKPQARDNPVLIMAGGFGTRLQPLTDHCPKPMLRVGEKPMLEHLIDQFVSFGFHNFYISTHYLPGIIREHFGDGSKWNVSIQYVHEDNPLGTGGALGLLPKNRPNLPLIMMNGDVLTKLNYSELLRHHEESGFDATLCVREDEHRVPFGVIETENQLITDMVEKPTYRYKINTGIYVLNPEIVDSVQVDQRIDMPTLLELHRANDKRIGTYTSYDYWLDIGQIKDYQKAQSDITNFK